jgi:large subunit ribosomal protein L17
MNKKVFGRKLSRSRPAREALFSSLIKGMIANGKVVTTKAKAKAIIGDLEHMVTLAKRADLNSRRTALSYLDNAKEAVDILFKQVGPVFSGRISGFTRIINLPSRKGDRAQMARIEWTDVVDYSKKPTVNSKSGKKDKVEKSETKKTKAEVKKVKKQ